MVVKVEKDIKENELEIISNMYYNFYEKLYRTPLMKVVFDDIEHAKNNAINQLKEVEDLYMLKIFNDSKELLVIARFLIDQDELLVGEILQTEKVPTINKDSMNLLIMKIFEYYTQKLDKDKLTLEIPWFDKDYQELAKTQDYKLPNTIFKYETVFAEKNLVKYKGEDDGRITNRK